MDAQKTPQPLSDLFIGIAGMIGAGKSTLATALGKHLDLPVYYEPVEDNEYLADFYRDTQRYAFATQIYLLNRRFQQHQEIIWRGGGGVQDRTIYEDAHIFAPNLHAMGLMTTRDFENYRALFDLMEQFITAPDLLIYLRASVPKLVENIQRRGRPYEEAIRLDYLNRLNERYEAWVSTYKAGKLLIIDIDANRFHEDKRDLGTIIESIDAELHGLFVG